MTPEQKAHKAEYDRKRREEKREEIAAKKRAYYLANKEKEDARVRKWVSENRARSAEIKKAWKARNPDVDRGYYVSNVEKFRALRRANYAANKNAYIKRAALRLKLERRATPDWADRQVLKDIYVEAEYMQMHVDHIIPLKGKLVCGLHVPENLQLLSPEANRRKSNKFIEELVYAC